MIGKLDRKITVETKTTVTDAWGQQLDMWAELGTFWAQYKPSIARRAAALAETADQLQFKEVASFILRYRGDIPDTARILYEGKVWRIMQRGEAGQGRRRYLELLCVALNSDVNDGN